MPWDTVWELAKPFLTVGAALALFKLLAPKWVEAQFNIQLEKRKHIQQKCQRSLEMSPCSVH
jgi:hypothetical protein